VREDIFFKWTHPKMIPYANHALHQVTYKEGMIVILILAVEVHHCPFLKLE
jgi:hypothetical protein